MSDQPVKLVTATDESRKEAIELVEALLAELREDAIAPSAVVVAYAHTQGQRERIRVRYFGKGPHLLALASRATHEINDHIDSDNE